MQSKPTDIVIAGLGGQGVMTASGILAEAAVIAGFDVKKSETKGMSQRGGSVTSDVRFGSQVLSPMVSSGEADYLLVLDPTQVEPNRHMLRPEGVLITPDAANPERLNNRKALNIALLGVLSAHLPIPEEDWLDVIRRAFPESLFGQNRQAFLCGRTTLQAV